MSTSNSLRAALACMGLGLALLAPGADAADKFPGVGRGATPAEVAAWDIDVRPDFKGLPAGSGTVLRGSDIWEGKCASCHGSFGESNEVFTPLAGGTSADDIRSGRVAALAGNSQPQRTTLMKVSTVSTLWDYIHRAMPWDNPKSLSPDEVYAVTAYLLNLGEIVPEDFELSDRNIAEVQARMPNRNGMTRDHGMWLASDKPDTQNTACMSNCVETVKVSSELPPYARNAHGDIAAQNRLIGPVRGANTLAPPLAGAAGGNADAVRRHASQTIVPAASMPAPAPAAAATAPSASGPAPAASGADLAGARLATSGACVACHAADRKMIGPSYRDVAAKYDGKSDAHALLAQKIRKGGGGVWGAMPMPPNPGVSDDDLKRIVDWILAGAPAPG
ncbi:c-type cytochrome [Achromobacter deleyi]|uniref:c-type cytochrome n=1 Tax=Achromobacter deleyi TaxID=1353891 RepID=UPI003AF27040